MESKLAASSNSGEQAELDLSTSASVAFVSISAALCLVFVLVYCNSQCGQGRAMLWRLLRRRKRAGPPLLPTVSYRKAEEATTRGCVVCLSEFEEMEVVKVIPACGHVFHPECIDRWIAKSRSCPVCRCSEMFVGGGVEGEEEEGGGDQEIGEGLVRLERSRSWCCREVGSGGEITRGMRRTCSF